MTVHYTECGGGGGDLVIMSCAWYAVVSALIKPVQHRGLFRFASFTCDIKRCCLVTRQTTDDIGTLSCGGATSVGFWSIAFALSAASC